MNISRWAKFKTFGSFENPHFDILWNLITAEFAQSLDYLLRGNSRARGVPQRKRRKPVSVQMLGRAFKFGKRNERVAAFFGARRVHVKQNRAVALYNQRILKLFDLRRVLHKFYFTMESRFFQ